MSMMGQIATLSDQLATMPDNMLGRIAQQYKNDAVSLSLILNEKNRREKLRMAQAGQAGQQPQPKVNDQVIASMAPHQLPENVGIGALPAPNMEHMAAGGLVAFADGGEVEHYANEGQVPPSSGIDYNAVDPFAQLPSAQRQAELTKQANQTSFVSMPLADLAQRALLKQQQGLQLTPEEARALALAQATANTGSVFKPSANAVSTEVKPDIEMPSPKTGRAAGAQQAPAKQPEAPAANAGVGAGRSGYPSSLENMNPQQYLTQIQSLGRRGVYDDPDNPLMQKAQAVSAAELAGAKEASDALEASIAKRGDLYAAREQRIQKQENDLLKGKDEATGLALLTAASKLFSVAGPRGIGEAIGAGSAEYKSGLAQLKAAQDRLADARDRLDDLRINRDDYNERERRAAKAAISKATTDGMSRAYDAYAKMYDMSREDVRTAVTASLQDLVSRRSLQGTMYSADQSLAGNKYSADATKGLYADARNTAAVEKVRQDISAAALKAFPYDPVARQKYETTKWNEAVQANPGLAKLTGAAGGSSAAGADFVYDPVKGLVPRN